MVLALARYSQAVDADYIVVHSPVLHFGAHTVETVYEYYRRACTSFPTAAQRRQPVQGHRAYLSPTGI